MYSDRMAWVVDRGLNKLLDQINAMAPGRSRISDGSIGDARHATSVSDHNPQVPAPRGNPRNQVDARDFTHDPRHGADMHKISEAIRKSHDRRVSYVIFDRRIFSSYPVGSVPAWKWRPYGGSNPHTHHMHVSVNDKHHDETQDWSIATVSFNEVWRTDRIKAPRVNASGDPMSTDALNKNPTWTAESYLREMLDDLRKIGAASKIRDEEIRDLLNSVRPQPVIDYDVLASKVAAELIKSLVNKS